MRVFRGKLCAALKAHADIRRPQTMSSTGYRNLLNQLGRKDWHVEIMEPYEHGEGVINYLARYVKGGPINNGQLHEVHDKVILKYQSHRTQRQELHSYSRKGFITQLLIHVPDKGKRTLRFYGLYTSGKRKALNQARALHKQAPAETKLPEFDWQSYLEQQGGGEHIRCSTCQKLLIPKERLFRGRDPSTSWYYILNNVEKLNLVA